MHEQDIIKMAAKAGADAAIDHYERERRKNEAQKKEKCLRNTKLLLKNYREFKAFAENAISDAAEAENCAENGNTLEDIVKLMWDPYDRSEIIVKSIKSSAIKTKIIMAHIDCMLSVFCEMSYNSGKPEDIRRYEVMYDKYISDEQMTPDEISKKHHIELRTFYNDLKTSQERFSGLLFGVDSIMNM